MTRDVLEGLKKTDITLIPLEGAVTGDYLCTWWNQSGAADGLGLVDGMRDALCQEAIFDTEKYYHHAEKEMRKGLIFLVDDGWDIPLGTVYDGSHNDLYGAVAPCEKKFSRFGNTPAERLRGMCDKVKEMGYAGLGLWISPQMSTIRGDDECEDDHVAYWEKRAQWSHDAGVLYWKVDWGRHDADDSYRALISGCVRRVAPEIFVEHAVVQKPLTHNHGEDFPEHRAARVRKQMIFSDVYRTYDVLDPFERVCTLRRAHEALLAADLPVHSGRGLINGENIYSVTAALGLCTGIMNYNKEAKACLNWHRIAPPFSIFEGEYRYSDNELCDSLFFDTEKCSWAPCKARTVKESAPAIMARNCPLPIVEPVSDNEPFVIASKHPETDAYSVAALKRTVDPMKEVWFLADVEIEDASVDAPIGVFGVFNTLTIGFDEPFPDDGKVLCEDLCGGGAYDITALVKIEDEKVTLDGKLLRYIGKINRGHGDWSAPSVVIKIEV